jgi:hypothetical protein
VLDLKACPNRPQSVAAPVVLRTSSGFWYSRGEGWLKRIVDGRKKHKKKESGEFVHIKMATEHVRLPFLYGVKEGFLGVYLPRSFSPIW